MSQREDQTTREGWIIAELTMPPTWLDPVRTHERTAAERHSRTSTPYALWQQRTNDITQHTRIWLVEHAVADNRALTAWDGWGRIIGAIPTHSAELPTDPSRSWHALVQCRMTARACKDWAKADQVRDELAALGVVTAEAKDGTVTWTKGV